MQIRYKITFVYATTVAIILLLLCFSIYFLSAQDRTSQFRDRLKARGLAIHRLLKTNRLEPAVVQEVIRVPSSALNQKSIHVYDSTGNLILAENDKGAPVLQVKADVLRKISQRQDYYFKTGERDALVFKAGNSTMVIAAYDDDRIEWLRKLRLTLMISFFLSIALVIFVGYVFSLGLVRSIRKISEKLSHISTRDFSQRLETGDNHDELDQLATTINNLLSRLQHSFETQSRFIDNASHELSTPLAVILSQLEIARQRNRSKEEYEALVDSVYEDVSRLDLLVKSLLDLAKLSGSQNGLELQYFRIDDLMMQLPVAIRKINTSYNVKLIFDEFPEDEEKMKVYGNEALLFCALYNIMHNACKYSSDNAAVIKLSFTDDNIRILIQDQGPGIAKEDLPHIFQPFYRSLKVNASVAGTGLGLALAKNIIKLHNGTINVETEKGAGTSFLVEIKQKPV